MNSQALEFPQTNVNAFAAGLLELGYKKGTKLAVWLGNEVEQVVAVLAACKIGATVVSLDPALSTDAALYVVYIPAISCSPLVVSSKLSCDAHARPFMTVMLSRPRAAVACCLALASEAELALQQLPRCSQTSTCVCAHTCASHTCLFHPSD